MLTRAVRFRLLAFVVVALLGVSFVGARYAGLDRLFGPRGYVVRVELADSGGIFSNAEVTYRGVMIGRVGALHLAPEGIVADLDIDSTGTKIPDDVEAVVADRSAVGEQYVDLRPSRDGAPFLAAGAVIPQQRTETPLPVQQLLGNLDGLASSVPTQSLRTVVDELDTAFGGSGPNLQRLLDASRSLTAAADAHLPQTTRLLADGRTVLLTQNADSSAITSFSRDLGTLAGQLKQSDPDLRALIANAGPAAVQVDALLRESGPQLGVLLANLLTTSNMMVTRQDGLEQVLVTYPVVVDGGYTVVPGDGTAHFGLVLNTFDPPPCTRGYQSTQRRPGDVTTPAPLNFSAHCAEPSGSPINVRGVQNAPSGGVPAAAQPGSFQAGQDTAPAVAGPSLPGLLGLPGLRPGPATLAELLGLPD